MKILYIAPENTVGTPEIWEKIHRGRGNEYRFVSLFRSAHNFNHGICLNLPLVASRPWYMRSRHEYYKKTRGARGDYEERSGFPPVWRPSNCLESAYFKLRDWMWSFKVERAIKMYDLLSFDIVHLEWGLEFYRDGRFVERLKEKNIPVVCTYHGQDLRTRGVIPAIDGYSSLNLTSELDLLDKHPNLHYLFLPYDTSRHRKDITVNEKIRIVHAPTNRYYKGSETIIPVCETIAKEEDVEFILIENKPHSEAQKIKESCDILIDQVHDRGGWGYGMNSVEAMAMGLCCVTELNEKYKRFIPDNPFVHVTGKTLYQKLKELVSDRNRLLEKKRLSREWVVAHHDFQKVGDDLYNYYREHLGLG